MKFLVCALFASLTYGSASAAPGTVDLKRFKKKIGTLIVSKNNTNEVSCFHKKDSQGQPSSECVKLFCRVRESRDEKGWVIQVSESTKFEDANPTTASNYVETEDATLAFFYGKNAGKFESKQTKIGITAPFSYDVYKVTMPKSELSSRAYGCRNEMVASIKSYLTAMSDRDVMIAEQKSCTIGFRVDGIETPIELHSKESHCNFAD